MKAVNILTAGALALATFSPVLAADAPMSDAQKKQVEQVIHDYLIQNPEVLVEVSQVLQQKQQKAMQEGALSAINENAKDLFANNITTVGNPKGNVTLVEFFDYQCGHCKQMRPVLDELIKSNNNLRVIYFEFPIFGKTSEIASRAALAAAMQGKYDALHQALLKADQHLNEAVVLQIAKSAGLDVDKLKTDMNSQKVTGILEMNRRLAEKLHLMGTPAFIIASTPGGQLKAGSKPAFVPGAASPQTLQDLIKNVSA